MAYADAEAVWREHRETTRGRDLDITGLAWRCSTGWARSNGRCPKARRKVGPASTRTACSRRRTARRASSPCRTDRRPSRATPAIRSR
jgi:hypothetical protein